MLSYAPWLSNSKGILSHTIDQQMLFYSRNGWYNEATTVVNPFVCGKIVFFIGLLSSRDTRRVEGVRVPKDCTRLYNNISKGFINDRFNTWKDAPSGEFLISLPNY